MNFKRERKIFFLFISFYLLVTLIITKIFYFSYIKYNPIDSEKKQNLFNLNDNNRADIIDRNGIILAKNIRTYNFFLKKSLLEDEKFIAKRLAEALDLSEENLYKKITKSKAKNILIKRHLLEHEKKILQKLPIASMNFEEDSIRHYVHDNLFSNIIGYTDIDGNGLNGIEEYYNDYLKTMSIPLKLTLDVNLQNILREECFKVLEKYNSNFVIAVITKIQTGNILAAVSIPDYNLNRINEKTDSFNRITQGLYEVGSVMKIFTIANAFENKLVTKNTLFDISKDIEYEKYKIKDASHIKYLIEDKTNVSLENIFIMSSNIGTIQIAKKLGTNKQLQFFEKAGLLEKLNIDFNQLSLPIQPRKWSEINNMTISYGYGVSISPLHIIQAVNAIVNDGNFISLRFSYNFDRQTKFQLISKGTSDLMKDLFLLTTKKGTGKAAYINGYNVGGKSGTALKLSKFGYQKGENLVSFVGVFPMENPKYSIYVVIDRPKGKNEDLGSHVAAEAVKNIILNSLLFLEK